VNYSKFINIKTLKKSTNNAEEEEEYSEKKNRIISYPGLLRAINFVGPLLLLNKKYKKRRT
jgi:hypothetical protein